MFSLFDLYTCIHMHTCMYVCIGMYVYMFSENLEANYRHNAALVLYISLYIYWNQGHSLYNQEYTSQHSGKNLYINIDSILLSHQQILLKFYKLSLFWARITSKCHFVEVSFDYSVILPSVFFLFFPFMSYNFFEDYRPVIWENICSHDEIQV